MYIKYLSIIWLYNMHNIKINQNIKNINNDITLKHYEFKWNYEKRYILHALLINTC